MKPSQSSFCKNSTAENILYLFINTSQLFTLKCIKPVYVESKIKIKKFGVKILLIKQ